MTPSQCCNTSQYGSAIAPTSGATVNISTCNYLSEYSPISSVVAGSTYTLEVTSTTAWVTVYSGSSCGTYIADGASPLTFTAPNSGTYYVHWTVDASCATATGCETTTITENSSPPPPPPNSGCTDSTAINYNPIATVDDGSCIYCSSLTATTTVIDESAAGSFDGSIDISVAGGVPPFIYNWSGPNSFSDTTEDISALESGMYYITIIDSNGCVTSDSIEVLEYSIDVGVSAFISPSSSCSLDSTEQIIVQITNYNTLDATNFLVSYQYNGQTFTDSVTSVVPAGGSVIYTFNSTINTYLPGTYYLSSFTSNVLDLDYSNDTSATNFTNYYHDFYSSDYEMGFEPNQDFSGWVIEDANNDSCTWTLHPLSGFNQSYGIFYNWNTNGITAADDWLISQCFEFEANQTYSLEFKYRAAAAFFPEDMTVNIGSIQQGSSLSTVLLQMSNIINIVYDSTKITFSVPSTGTYYIGWHAVSNSSMWRIDLDDINISVILPDVYGCIDSTALNYDSLANVDDSSCVYCIYGCMDSTSFNYDSTATCPSICIPIIYGCMDSTAINYYTAANIDNGSCIYILFGCTDSLATNYNSLALYDDGSCIYPPGCMDSTAINYNPNAIISDSSCIYPPGCMDSTAINYNPNATVSDSTCVYCVYGCMDVLALNYDSLATCDNGSCMYSCGGITGVNLTDVIHDRATFNWDNMNLQNCQVDQIRFRYREVGTNSYSTKTMGVPVGSGCNTSNTSKLVLGLTPNTTYEYNFKIWYCNASTVNWHANGQFTTSPPCDNVTNVTVQPLNPSKVRVCWDSVSTYAFVRLKYRKDTAASTYYNIGGSGVYSPNLCKDKNGLAPNTNYKLIYRTWCSPSGGPYRSAQWDGPVLFSTPSIIRSDELSTISSLDVYPNPSRDVFNVEFISESKQSIEVRLVNLVGEIIFTENLENFEGEYTHSFNLSEYSKGIYLLELDTDNGIVNKKLILQ